MLESESSPRKGFQMTDTTDTANLPALGAHERGEVGDQLQATLVELVDLSLIGKQLHWNVVGKDFRSLHLQLDELIDEWRELGDTVAERSVAIGHAPDGRSATVAAQSGIAAMPTGTIEDHEVVRLLTHALAEVCERIRGRLEKVGEIDPASEDVLIEALRALERQLWMVRAQLGG